ncbi:hypothetical protein [Roseitalea porphyridii]|uniref:Uncharacterized protein n=1 Tax=Roseitalea porphyridii TaxID=1852022 RepID=A0A4P6V2Y2_9HYPH|nr:hypothetical protein [Roseitalea porphyridii]QBK31761.1 hypothetical protein E0E05_14810 [Roseitalea porphyridii]
MKPKKITVEASPDHPDVLDVRDAMQQVMDYFDLLTDRGQSDVVWNLVSASTNSPFTAEGVPVDLRTNAPAYGQVQEYVAVIERGFARLKGGEPLDVDFPAEKREVAKRILKRNLNGIGRTVIDLGDDAIYEIVPQQAERSLAALNGEDDEEYDYLFSTFARKEFGAIEGRIIDLSTDYNEPSIKLKEHRSGREIQCRISDLAREEIENSLTAGDVWTHRRARVRGIINYDPSGKIVRVYDGRIAFIETKGTKISDLRDPHFTGGLPAYEYIDRLRENELG